MKAPGVPALFIFAFLIVIPAMLTWGLVRLLLARDPLASRRRIVSIAVPLGAILPLLPGSFVVARAQMIDNPILIAVAGTLMVGAVVGLLVCLPLALSLTRR